MVVIYSDIWKNSVAKSLVKSDTLSLEPRIVMLLSENFDVAFNGLVFIVLTNGPKVRGF
jgi:hypothetical protein